MAATIKNCRATLIVSIIFLSSVFGLSFRRSIINGVGDGNAIPDGADKVGIVATVTMAVAIAMVTVMIAMVTVMAAMDFATRNEWRTRHGRVPLRSERRDARRRSVDWTASETG